MASIQLKDLVPGKNYKVKVRAKYKGEDPGPWSKILNFKAPIKSKDDDDDTLNSKYGIVVGSKKDPKRGYIISSTFNGKITLKNGLVIDDDKNNTNIGTQGWAIDHKGNSIFNNIVARGQLIIDLNNNQGRMYFGENIPAFGTDKADGIKLDTYNYWFRTKSIADKRPSWRVGDADSFVSYNPDSSSADGKLIVSGQIQAGLGTQNQVLLGANVGGSGIAGIKIDGSNFWYDSDKVAANAIFFKVSGADATAITVNKAGRVVINSDHSGGRMTGPLTIRLDKTDAVDKFLIGQDVRSGEQDGIVLNSNNYWTLANSNKAAYFKVGGASKYILWDGNDLTVSAQITAGVAPDNVVRLGPDVGGTGIGGIKLDNNNFWYDPTKVTGTNIFFQVKSDNQQTSISVAKGGNVLINGEQTGGSVTGTLNVTTSGSNSGKVAIPYATGKNILIGKNVSGSNDGLYLDANNFWYINNQNSQSTFNLKAGISTSYLQFTGTRLEIRGASVRTSNATNGYIEFDDTKIVGVANNVENFKIDTSGNAYFKGTVGPNSELGTSSVTVSDSNAPSNLDGGIFFKDLSVGAGQYRGIAISPSTNYGQILWYKDSATVPLGGIFSLEGTKYGVLSSGIGIGNSSGYPFIEVGYELLNGQNIPKIIISAGENSLEEVMGLEIREKNFILRGGDASRIKGIPVNTSQPANKKVLYGDDDQNLEWGPAPTGTGGGGDLKLSTALDTVLQYNSSTSTLSLDQQSANTVFAGHKISGTTAVPTFRGLVAADLPIAAGTGISLSTDADDKMRITSTSSAGYSNGTNVGNINKITYSNTVPSTAPGRTNGDIHFTL